MKMMKNIKLNLMAFIFIVLFLACASYAASGDNLISIEAKDKEISEVLCEIAETGGFNLVINKNVTGRITVKLKEVSLEKALKAVVQANNYTYTINGDVINIYSYEGFNQYERFAPLVTRVFTLKNVDVSSLRRALMSIKTARGKVELNLKGNQAVITDTPDRIKEIEVVLKEIDKERELLKYKLKYAEAEEVKKKLMEVITEDKGDVFVDERTNSVIVKTADPILQNIDELIKGWDVQHKQVLIEAKILQVTLDKSQKLGIDWEYAAPDSDNPKGEPAGWDLQGDFGVDLTSGGIFRIGTLSTDNYRATLEMLESNSNTEILSSPRVVVIDNHEANILVGSSEPYIVTSTDSNTGWVTEETKFKDVGLKLIVTPRIGEDSFITMTIHPEVSTARRVAEVDNALAIDTTQADTTMMVKDGETVVLGGLMKDSRINTTKKIPILGDIPILGYLFRSEQKEDVKTEIVVFITPHILNNENRESVSRQDIENVITRTKTTIDVFSDVIRFEQEQQLQ